MTWRRSAVSWVFGSVAVIGLGCCRSRTGKLADSRENFPPMPEQDADVLEILIGQMAENRDIDPVLGKALRVLGQPSFLSQSAICCIAVPRAD